MTIVHILGYHTCKTEGGWSYVKSEAPFLSGSEENQWLTQGYYFWTDSDHFAHKWGECSYNDEYAIVECNIEIENELFLDLVGSVKSQLYFEKCLAKFSARLKKIDSTKEPTVQAVISYWRDISKQNVGIFPFVAIKAEDSLNKYNTKALSFIGTQEKMIVSIKRQQLCLFECGSKLIRRKEVIYPREFIKGANHE